MPDYEARAGLWHAAVLCLIAGFVDIIGYIDLGHVFTANMTGNTVLLGVAIVKGDAIAVSYAATIAAFVFGAAAATLLKLVRVSLPALLAVAGLLLLWITGMRLTALPALCALAFVMGLQGAAISTFSGIRLPTVVVTSTLVNLVDGLVRRAADRTEAASARDPQLRHLAAAWVAYGVGGGAAVFADRHLAVPLVVPALLYAVVATGLMLGRR